MCATLRLQTFDEGYHYQRKEKREIVALVSF